jgi:osmotically-inducible protein OsmY
MLLRSPDPCDVVRFVQNRLQRLLLIEVSCESCDGIVYLRGHTDSYYQKQLAQEAVRRLDGVEAVVNEITVSASAG